jgi:chromate transporter
VNRLLLHLAAIFAGLSFISIGGANVLLPEIHRRVVGTLHWMDDPTFAQLFAISQAAPGPNVMLASLIGWHMAGLAGLLVATAAILLPSSVLALMVGRGLRLYRESVAVRALERGLVPIALGLMVASGLVAARTSHGGLLGYAMTAGAAATVIFTKRNPLLPMAVGTAMYMGWHIMGQG